MSKCPECNADMVWKGSMMSGGLACPFESAHFIAEIFKDALEQSVSDIAQALQQPDPDADIKNYSFLYVFDDPLLSKISFIKCSKCLSEFTIAKTDVRQRLYCTCGAEGYVVNPPDAP